MEADKWNPTTGERSDQDNLPAPCAVRGRPQADAVPAAHGESECEEEQDDMAGLDLWLEANRP